MSPGETKILDLIDCGVLSVDQRGRILRHMQRGRTGRYRRVPTCGADKIRPDGYCCIQIEEDGVSYFAMSHRIVWASRNGAIPDGAEINHKNGDRADNRPDNLEPMTPGENTLHSYRVLGRRACSGEANGRAKLKASEAREIRIRHSAGESKRALGREFGVSKTTVRKIVRGEFWRSA